MTFPWKIVMQMPIATAFIFFVNTNFMHWKWFIWKIQIIAFRSLFPADFDCPDFPSSPINQNIRILLHILQLASSNFSRTQTINLPMSNELSQYAPTFYCHRKLHNTNQRQNSAIQLANPEHTMNPWTTQNRIQSPNRTGPERAESLKECSRCRTWPIASDRHVCWTCDPHPRLQKWMQMRIST